MQDVQSSQVYISVHSRGQVCMAPCQSNLHMLLWQSLPVTPLVHHTPLLEHANFTDSEHIPT